MSEFQQEGEREVRKGGDEKAGDNLDSFRMGAMDKEQSPLTKVDSQSTANSVLPGLELHDSKAEPGKKESSSEKPDPKQSASSSPERSDISAKEGPNHPKLPGGPGGPGPSEEARRGKDDPNHPPIRGGNADRGNYPPPGRGGRR